MLRAPYILDRTILAIVNFASRTLLWPLDSNLDLTREYDTMRSEKMHIFLETSRDQFSKISFKTLRDRVCEKLVEVHKLVLKVAV